MILKKYDIVLLDLDPPKGHVQAGIRPAVLVQSNLLNNKLPTFIFVPITSVEKDVFPTEFLIHPSKENGLTKLSRFLGSQPIKIDREKVLKRLGHLEKKYYPLVKQALAISLDWENEF